MGLMRLAVSIFYEAVSESRFFARLRVSKSQFVPLTIFINYVLSLHNMEFQQGNFQIFREKVNPNFS